MIRSYLPVERLGLAAACISICAMVLTIIFGIHIAPTYPDFIAGYPGWSATGKWQDLAAGPAFILALVMSAAALGRRIISEREGDLPSPEREAFSRQLLYWSLPALMGALFLVGHPETDSRLFYLSGISVMVVSFIARQSSETNGLSPAESGMALVCVWGLALSPFSVHLAATRFFLRDFASEKTAVHAAGLLLLCGMMALVFLGRYRPVIVRRLLPLALLVTQLTLSLFFLVLLPAGLIDPSGTLRHYPVTPALYIAVCAVTLAALVDVIRRYLRSAPAGTEASLYPLVSPWSLLALLMALHVGHTQPPIVSADDYHFGEILLSWWSWLNGAQPYTQYIPAHGIIDDYSTGFVSWLFLGGDAGTFSESTRLAYAVMAIPTFFALRRTTSSTLLSFMALYAFEGRLVWLFFTLFLALWFDQALWRRPGRWLIVWCYSVPVLLLGVPAQGALLIAAATPTALLAVWRWWHSPARQDWKQGALALAVLLALLLATPAASMILQGLIYLRENGPINQLAYGIGWALSWTTPAARSVLMYDLARMSWMPVAAFCAYAVFCSMRRRPFLAVSLRVAALGLIFCLLMIPYTMGRIDPVGTSRTGVVSLFCWTLLLPIMCHACGPRIANVKALLLLLMALAGGLLGSPPAELSNMRSVAHANIQTPPMRDVAAAGLPRLGMGYFYDDHWRRLVSVAHILNTELPPRSPYLDLTSRNGLYFYTDRPPLLPVTAAYNMAPLSQQQKAVDIVSRKRPALALLEVDNIVHDGGGLALRAPVLYRYAMQHYTPEMNDGYVIGHLDSWTKPARLLAYAQDALVDARWDHGVDRNAPMIAVSDHNSLPLLQPGDEVTLASGERRAIRSLNLAENIVTLTGTPLTAAEGRVLTIAIPPARTAQYRSALQERAFAIHDLQMLPAAWGRSWASLQRRTTDERPIAPSPVDTHDVRAAGGVWQIAGPDPQLVFDISSLKTSGAARGMLHFDFECLSASSTPRIQIFWWGDAEGGASEAHSLVFTAGDSKGAMAVPLDSQPSWWNLKQVSRLRIDLDTAGACGAIVVKNLTLSQR